MFANGVLEGFLEYISCASASITSARERTASSLCDRGKSWVGESFPPILLLSLEWNVQARAETTNSIRLFCLCVPVNVAHMAVSVFTHWLAALSSQWENLQPKTTYPCPFCLVFFFKLDTPHASIMSCHIPAQRTEDALAFGNPESTPLEAGRVVFLGVQGQRWISWHQGEVGAVCCGWMCGRTSDSRWHCGCFHTKLTKSWRLAFWVARRQTNAPQTVTALQGRCQL